MMIISAIAMWISGCIIGFAWGLDKALRSPAFARGFLKGFYSWLPKKEPHQ